MPGFCSFFIVGVVGKLWGFNMWMWPVLLQNRRKTGFPFVYFLFVSLSSINFIA